MRRIHVAAFTCGLATTTALFAPTMADASSYRTFSAVGCAATYLGTSPPANYQYYQSIQFDKSTGQVSNPSSANATRLFCPIVGNEYTSPTASTAALELYGWWNGASTSNCSDGLYSDDWGVQACVGYYDGSGGGCGSQTTASASGAQAASPSVSEWSGRYQHDEYLAVIFLGCTSNSNKNALWSYQLKN
jgi:hypothetical protein